MLNPRNLRNSNTGTAALLLVYILVLIIVGVGIILPILNNLISTSGLTGISLTIVSIIGTLVAVALLYHIGGIF